MIVYYADESEIKPVQVTCKIFGYPNKDADGRMMYDNTHYKDEKDAWRNLRLNANARMELLIREISSMKHKLMDIEKRYVDAAIHKVDIKAEYKKWIEARESNDNSNQ